SANERCLSSAMEANDWTDLSELAGSGCAADTATPTAMIARAPESRIDAARMLFSLRLGCRVRERQREHALAGQLGPSIGDGRSDGRGARLADAGRLLFRGHNMYLDIGHLVNAQH